MASIEKNRIYTADLSVSTQSKSHSEETIRTHRFSQEFNLFEFYLSLFCDLQGHLHLIHFILLNFADCL
jgi:hypothetical protein